MELIERERLRTKAVECGKFAKQDPRLLVVGLGYVLEAPTIDAVPVVRCRECKHWKSRREYGDCNHWKENNGENAETCNDDFCSYGEKWEEPNNVQ